MCDNYHVLSNQASDGISRSLTPALRLRAVDITNVTRRLTLDDLGIGHSCCSNNGENSRELWDLLRYINMHNDRYNTTHETNVRCHHDVFDAENFLPSTSLFHFEEPRRGGCSNGETISEDQRRRLRNYRGITEISLNNWVNVNILELRSISLFLGTNLTCVSFAKCLNMTDEMIRAFTANVVNLQKLDVSDCIKLSDAAVREIVKSCGKTLIAIDISKCKLITNDSCRWIGGGSSFNMETPITRSRYPYDKKSVQNLKIGFGCKRLKHLNVSGCTQITDLGLRHIGWGCCRKLNLLNLSGCYRITDGGLMDALANSTTVPPLCQQIRLLNLEGCECITHQGLLSLIRVRNHSSIKGIGRVIEATTFFGFFCPPQSEDENTASTSESEALKDKAARQIQIWVRWSKYISMGKDLNCKNDVAKAACCVQNGFRYAIRKRRYICREHSVLFLQKYLRCWLLRLGSLRRGKAHKILIARLASSIMIQSLIRRSQVLKKWCIVQSVVQQVRLSRRNKPRNYLVAKVQKCIRRHAAKSCVRFERLRNQKAKKSAVKLQSIYRKLQDTRILSSLAHEAIVSFLTRQKALLLIQSRARARRAVVRFLSANRSCLLIQAIYRSHMVFSQQRRFNRRKFISQTFAAICIQRYFRGRQIIHWQQIRMHMFAEHVLKSQTSEMEKCQLRVLYRCNEMWLHNAQIVKSPVRDAEKDAAIFIQRYYRGKQIMTWQEIRRHITGAKTIERQTAEMKEGRRRALLRCTELWLTKR